MAEKILSICGPTATGKTSLAVFLAKKFNGEIVSVDSRQVYRGMNIGTGKDVPENSEYRIQNTGLSAKSYQLKAGSKSYRIGYHLFDGARVWMLDVVEPEYRFSVADYVACARPIINDIWQREKLPVLVGGTGFYLRALLEGVGTIGVTPNDELRQELAGLSVGELADKLKKVDVEKWKKMNASDRNNPRRLVRAIEVVLTGGGGVVGGPDGLVTKEVNVLKIGLVADYKFLYDRIDQRVDERMKAGMVEEAESLLKSGVSHSRLQEFGLEYRCLDDFLTGKIGKEAMIQKLKFEIHSFARRQMTWFKGDKKVLWFDISQSDFREMVVAEVDTWYSKK